jgi:hypothetical protein
MVFVDELDGDDGCCGFGRDGFADAIVAIVLACCSGKSKVTGCSVRCVCARADGLGDDAKG